MNTLEYNASELNREDLKQTNGGFFFFILAIVNATAVNTACAAIIATPLVASVVKGWNDASN